MNFAALVAVAVIAAAMFAVFGALYLEASESHRKGELAAEGLSVLRWALIGQLVLLLILAATAFLT